MSYPLRMNYLSPKEIHKTKSYSSRMNIVSAPTPISTTTTTTSATTTTIKTRSEQAPENVAPISFLDNELVFNTTYSNNHGEKRMRVIYDKIKNKNERMRKMWIRILSKRRLIRRSTFFH